MAKESAYTDSQITEQLKALPGWRHEGGALRRTYKTDGWPTTLMLVNAIGFYAEAADHHPDLEVSWGKVEVSLNTHSAGGITANGRLPTEVCLSPVSHLVDGCFP